MNRSSIIYWPREGATRASVSWRDADGWHASTVQNPSVALGLAASIAAKSGRHVTVYER